MLSITYNKYILKIKMHTDKCYIECINASKYFIWDIIYFEGSTAYEDAVAWGQANLENFNRDMVKYA